MSFTHDKRICEHPRAKDMAALCDCVCVYSCQSRNQIGHNMRVYVYATASISSQLRPIRSVLDVPARSLHTWGSRDTRRNTNTDVQRTMHGIASIRLQEKRRKQRTTTHTLLSLTCAADMLDNVYALSSCVLVWAQLRDTRYTFRRIKHGNCLLFWMLRHIRHRKSVDVRVWLARDKVAKPAWSVFGTRPRISLLLNSVRVDTRS